MIIIDSPPLAVTTEALEFIPLADAVVLLGRVGRTSTAAAERAAELVRFSGAERIAIALADSGSGRSRRGGYYDYYGGGRKRREKVVGPTVVGEPSDEESSDKEVEGPQVEHEPGSSNDWGHIDALLDPPEILTPSPHAE